MSVPSEFVTWCVSVLLIHVSVSESKPLFLLLLLLLLLLLCNAGLFFVAGIDAACENLLFVSFELFGSSCVLMLML